MVEECLSLSVCAGASVQLSPAVTTGCGGVSPAAGSARGGRGL